MVYLIPTILSENKTECIPGYVLDAVKNCSVFFVENERTARRYLKLLWREMVIDDYEWFNIKEVTPQVAAAFNQKLKENKNIGILSEAGCPGVADPGQQLVKIAQEKNVTVKPLVGPSSILLALMASGMNGQHFQFHGYLPIEANEKIRAIRSLESESRQKNCTQLFIETPYRNHQMMETIIKACQPDTRIGVAVDLTGDEEMVKTKTAAEWKRNMPEMHKKPAIFLIYAADSI